MEEIERKPYATREEELRKKMQEKSRKRPYGMKKKRWKNRKNHE